jgi:hypothetical protein
MALINSKDMWMQNDLENAAEDYYYDKEMSETLIEIVQDVGETAAPALNKTQKATRLGWCRERAGWTAND